jgi:hypothetical protein
MQFVGVDCLQCSAVYCIIVICSSLLVFSLRDGLSVCIDWPVTKAVAARIFDHYCNYNLDLSAAAASKFLLIIY